MPLFEGIGFTGEKTAIIIDIGAAYTKCGFAGEFGPRCIIPSELVKPQTGQVSKLWTLTNTDELYDVLKDFLHQLYFRHLLVNPRDRRVVVCESLLCPATFRDTLARVLFKHYEVPSILFAPAHQLALFTLGSNSGMVMDVGYKETLVVPIYEGIPVLKAWEAVPLGGQAFHQYLESRLLETANVTTEQQEDRPLSSVINSIDEKTLEDIKVRACFITKLERAKLIQAAHLHESGFQDSGANVLPTPPPQVMYPLDGNKVLHVNGKIRENTGELLFEQDNEERSVATLFLDSILKCPVDLRQFMATNLVVVGGGAMMPGFMSRLREELYDLLEKPKYKENIALKEFKFHKLPAKENYAAWLGGSMFGALDILASRSVTREQYNQTNTIPDWASLAQTENVEKDETVRR